MDAHTMDANAIDQSAMDPTREFLKDVKRVVVKVGTAVVTKTDGKVALMRLSAVCEQVKWLIEMGKEVILVTSGAVGVGKQMLRHRKRLHMGFLDWEKRLDKEILDGKAAAALGQIRLMALYKAQFELLGGEAAQLLVTDSDFQNPAFREQLFITVSKLLETEVVPIFNENDAISTRKDPYKDKADKILWDNDSLAAFLAEALRADLLIILSDVEGVYTGHPNNATSKLIHTYLREKHESLVTFGAKSKVGRGGMEAKVTAALKASLSGIPTVIARGYDTDAIRKVFQGLRIGTLFHKDASQWTSVIESSAPELADSARSASSRLQGLSPAERRQALLDVANALEANEKQIMSENEADVRAAHKLDMPAALIARLSIGEVSTLVDSLRAIADMEDPLEQVLQRQEVAEGLILEKAYSPVGVVLVVFESRPDAVVQIASLAIRSGNGLLLKGGKEAQRSNALLHKIITEALPQSVGPELIGLVTSRDTMQDLLLMHGTIDLVIPRGGPELVKQVKELTKIPVLGYSDGVNHIYVDKAADIDIAKKVVYDSKLDYPAANNSMETLLVHEKLVETKTWEPIYCNLRFAGVKLYGGPRAVEVLRLEEATDLHKEYSGQQQVACTVEIVKDVYEAVSHINEYGSSHTDCIITEDDEIAEIFAKQVNSAAIFRNVSTRFCDGKRFGLGAELCISTNKIHPRGPLGVEGLLTTRWLLKGHGHVVAKDKGVQYTHKNLPLDNAEPKRPRSSTKGGDIVSNGNGYSVHSEIP